MVNNPPCNVEDTGLILGWGTKIPYDAGRLRHDKSHRHKRTDTKKIFSTHMTKERFTRVFLTNSQRYAGQSPQKTAAHTQHAGKT